jgi:integrase
MEVLYAPTGHSAWASARVAVATGMRPSEYLGLKWQDIDWARQTVRVVRSLRRLNGKWCLADTKRSRSRRPIKPQSWIGDILHGLYMARTTATTSNSLFPEGIDLVFKTVLGRPMNTDCLARAAKSNVEKIKPQDLAGAAGSPDEV